MRSQHHSFRARFGVIAGTAAALAAGAILLAAAPAAAHVHVDGSASPGERATVTFRVPTESATASTTAITITLPTDTPITSVRPQSKAGWRIEVQEVELDPPVVNGGLSIASAVASVTWTATGEGIRPGEFDEFVVQLGPIPDVDELVIPTRQDYSDGTSVDWSETSEDGAEPAHPAPVLAIGERAEGDHGHGRDEADGAGANGDADAAQTLQGLDGFAIAGFVTGGIGLVAAVLAIVVAIRAERRARKL